MSNKRRSGKARIYCQKKQKRYPPDVVSVALIALIGAPRSDAASSFPPGRGRLFSNDIFGLGRLYSILRKAVSTPLLESALALRRRIGLPSRSRLALF
ncbi:hypothetical protein HMPREF1986_01942 [Oribacterium sp. oral taxon 078 str. F0263]|nr:hypothetical protein HMPREF1986_01942 [Oribacterium sp. oral taxon 078 str. F0263]